MCGGAGAASAYAYDTNGNLTSKTDFNGKKACFAYDTARNLQTARVEGLTSAENCTTALASPPNRPDVRKVTTTWHATWRQPAAIVEPAPGGTRSITFTYNANGDLTQKKITAPKNDGTATTITRTWKWTYGTLGRVLTASDPNNKVTTTTYHSDTDPDLGKRGQVATVTNPLGHATQYTTYDAGNRLTSLSDPNGVVSAMTYDARGRLTSRTVDGETTTYTYDLAGQLTDVEMPDGAIVSNVYDAAHRLTEVQDGLGNKIVYALDGMGNRTSEQAFDPAGALARTRTRVYDNLNRLAQEVGAQSQATVMTYDGNGNRLSSTDPLNHATVSTYDALNRLLTVTDPGNGLAQYSYDSSNNLTGVTDPRSLVTTYGYDGLGNQVKQVSPDTGTTNRTFDAAGNLKTSTDARGAVATYTYDGSSRVTKVVHSQTGFPSETHTFTFDGGATGAPNAKGRLTQLVDPSGTTKWTWTPHGRVASRQQIAGSVTLSQSYTWTSGRLTGIVTPSGQAIGLTYANGRLRGVTLNGSALVSGGEHEPFGPIALWQWANGHTTYRDYDLDGRLETWEYRNGASIVRRDLTWDHANRITAITDPSDAANSHAYGYDALDRLNTAQSGAPVPTTRQYAYDPIGNRQNATIDGALTNYGYSPSSNQLLNLTGATSRSYTYDAIGNPVHLDGRTSTYNLANRLVKLADGAVTVATYKLNGLGQRVAKTLGSTTTRYFYDEQGRLTGEYAANGTLIQETIWLDDLSIATLRPTGTGNPTPVAVYFVHADHLGTPRAITRPSDNAFVWRWDNADPFGSNAADQNPGGLGNFVYTMRFPGQQFDAENGKAYNYFRDYDAFTGKYAQSDPIGLQGGINTYGYVAQQPLFAIDPTGLYVRVCSRPLLGLPMFWRLRHDFLDVNGIDYGFYCKGGGICPVSGPGEIRPNVETRPFRNCNDVDCINEGRLMAKIAADMANPPYYELFCTNCQNWAVQTLFDSLDPEKCTNCKP
ncbi:MAG: RHS repeat-associated core domain-containing protein [Betaproteobacteria bacterium]